MVSSDKMAMIRLRNIDGDSASAVPESQSAYNNIIGVGWHVYLLNMSSSCSEPAGARPARPSQPTDWSCVVVFFPSKR